APLTRRPGRVTHSRRTGPGRGPSSNASTGLGAAAEELLQEPALARRSGGGGRLHLGLVLDVGRVETARILLQAPADAFGRFLGGEGGAHPTGGSALLGGHGEDRLRRERELDVEDDGAT